LTIKIAPPEQQQVAVHL